MYRWKRYTETTVSGIMERSTIRHPSNVIYNVSKPSGNPNLAFKPVALIAAFTRRGIHVPKHFTWDDLVDTDKNSPNKTQKQVTDNPDNRHDEIRELISQLSPNAGSYVPDVVGAYIYQKCGNEGFPIFDDWYKNASDYPGTEKAQEEYASCAEIKHPVDKTSVLKLINDTSNTETHHTDEQTECLEKSDSDVTDEAESANVTDNTRQPIIFDGNSLTGKSETLKTQLSDQVDVIDQLAILGNLHYFFGAPNTGKTLLTISLLLESIQSGRIKASNVFYFNLDDPFHDLVKKVEIFEELGVHIIADGHEGFNVSNFTQMLNEIIRRDQAHKIILVLDTLKKFVDVMNKSQVREWNKTLRRFTGKGGTVIALAHVNKNVNQSGKTVYAGVADLVDDCDAAYIINKVSTDDKTQLAIVEFENIKRRGNIASQVAFSYSVDPTIGYEERLASVERVDLDNLIKIKEAELLRTDTDLIAAAINSIEEDINTKMRLRDAISERTGISKRKAVQLIEKYEGTDPSQHKWTFTVHEHGRKVYSLLTGDIDEK